jgi:putative flippase GtrA
LKKDKKSAVYLASITVFSFAVTDAVLNLLIPYLISGDIHLVVANPESLHQPGVLLGLLVVLAIILAVLIGIAAFWLYRFFGEAYYGKRGAARWALFGFLFAVFLKLPEWFLPPNLWPVRAILQFLGLFAAFFLARRIIPIRPSGLNEGDN